MQRRAGVARESAVLVAGTASGLSNRGSHRSPETLP